MSPQILNLLITFVEDKQEMWKGFLYVVLLAITSILIGKQSCRESELKPRIKQRLTALYSFKTLYEKSSLLHCLKGQCHSDFRFSTWISFPQALIIRAV